MFLVCALQPLPRAPAGPSSSSSLLPAHPPTYPAALLQLTIISLIPYLLRPLPHCQVKCIVGNATHSWEPSVTHIVAPRMKRSQKCLAGLAAGNWILGRRYVDACKEARELLPPVRKQMGRGRS